jgi:hypothetical protein
VTEANDKQDPPKSMNAVLDRFEQAAAEKEEVSLENLMEAVGRRSFGPLLLLAGIVLSAPGISDIPSVPTIVGTFILLVSVQILFGRKDFWLPGWLLQRTVSCKRLEKMASSKWIRKPAAAVDRFTVERLRPLAGPRMNVVIAAVTTVLALVSPITELVPLSSMGVGAAVTAFGISLVARDGLMAVIGLALSGTTVTLALLAM